MTDLRDEELFYFQARGIDRVAARMALVTGFGMEVVERFEPAPARARAVAALQSQLKACVVA